MNNLTASELKSELKKHVFKMADDLVIGLKENNKKVINNSIRKKELCIR